jgi:hypothetical protein
MRAMDRRRFVTGVALSLALLIGGTTTAAGPACDSPSSFGQHTSELARMHGGTAAATAHHNAMHGTDLTVGAHQQVMHAMCGKMS